MQAYNINRREFLKSASAAALALGLPGRILGMEETAKPDIKRFDFNTGDISEKYSSLHERIV